jgi:tetratricopeptide (TPR) repeat protein
LTPHQPRRLQTCLCVALLAAALASTRVTAADQGRSGDSVYDLVSESIFLLQLTDADGDDVGTASGFLVDSNLLITNAHVARVGSIFLQVGTIQLPCVLERTDEANDLALCRIQAKATAQPLKFAEREPKRGAAIYAIGNPRGLEKTISQGLFNGHRTVDGREVTQVSAPISPGSSGGPILDSNAEVIGVAVSFLADGQNLTFAVPLNAVKRFIHNEPGAMDVRALIVTATSLLGQLHQMKFSKDPASGWAGTSSRITELLIEAIAGSSDVDVLEEIYDAAGPTRQDIALAAARKALKLSASPSSAAYSRLARALYGSTSTTGKSPTLDEAEEAAEAAIERARPVALDDFELLGDIQAQAEKHALAYSSYLRAAVLAKDGDSGVGPLYFALFETSAALGRNSEAEKWFGRAKATGLDALQWRSFAVFLESQDRASDAGTANMEASRLLPGNYSYVCSAGTDYYLGNNIDLALAACRQCIELAAAKKGAEGEIGRAHRMIGDLLNRRGVRDEAASHAKEALAIDPGDAWAYHNLSEALQGLHRFTEAVAAAKSAIRVSDGKYPGMHSQLGSVLFDLKEWPEAGEAYRKAAELDPVSAAAAFNVANSFYNQQQSESALKWYRATLERDANFSDSETVVRRIRELSK